MIDEVGLESDFCYECNDFYDGESPLGGLMSGVLNVAHVVGLALVYSLLYNFRWV